MKERTWLSILLSYAGPCRGKMAASVALAVVSVAGGFVPYLGVYQILRLFVERRAGLEGILLWCLEGLHRLVQNNFRFTVSERAAANVDTIKRSSNNVIDFMESEGYFRFKADYSISSKEFYDIYKQWCEDNACHSVSAISFSAELRQNDRRYNLEATNNIYLPGGRRVRGFVGIEPLVHPCP